MKFWSSMQRLTLLIAVVMAVSITAPAGFITAYEWKTTEALASSGTGASAATLAILGCHGAGVGCTTGNADVTFSTNGMNFVANGLNDTVATFLASSAFILDGLVNSVGASPLEATMWLFMTMASL